MVAKFLHGETSNLIDVNKMLNLSRTLDTRDMEISYRQGFMVGSAWKDGIISSMRSRSYNWVSISDLVFVSVLYSRKFLTFWCICLWVWLHRVLIRGLFCLLIFLLSSKYQHATGRWSLTFLKIIDEHSHITTIYINIPIGLVSSDLWHIPWYIFWLVTNNFEFLNRQR